MNLFNLIDKAISVAAGAVRFKLPRPPVQPESLLKGPYEISREPLYSRVTCNGNQILHFFRVPVGVNNSTGCDTNMLLCGSLPNSVFMLANGLTFFTPEKDEKIKRIFFDNAHFSFDIANIRYIARPAGGAGPKLIDGGAQHHRLLDPLWITPNINFDVTLTFDNERSAAAVNGAQVMCLIHGLTYRPAF